MKITDVEAIVLRQPKIDDAKADGSQDALVIRISTDEGITGIGEADSVPSVIKAIVDAPPSHAVAGGLRHLLIGEDPFDTERLWDKLYRGSIYYGRRGAVIHAISGIDIALWDLKGKALGIPVWKLLGGSFRSEIRAYASALMPETVAEVETLVGSLVERGFTAVKLGWGPWGRDADLDVALARAARAAAGDGVELMFDIGLGWPDANHAIQQVRRLEEFRPYWVEEPLMPDDTAGYRKLADAVETRIACGEEDVTRWDFENLIEKTGVDVIQPDVTRVGGISESMRIVRLAELSGTEVVFHSWSTGIIKAATLQLAAACPRIPFFEYCVADTELNKRLVTERFPLKNGNVAIPQGPGIGIEIDEDVVREFTVA
ncbi:MAG: mandelate racemase/muconate lactonizing enzyme family protein [Chloroflexota bacterium]|nr:mandelate racemase/muconate lactonizing enzyme family protein [Chloroflexota bacterium]